MRTTHILRCISEIYYLITISVSMTLTCPIRDLFGYIYICLCRHWNYDRSIIIDYDGWYVLVYTSLGLALSCFSSFFGISHFSKIFRNILHERAIYESFLCFFSGKKSILKNWITILEIVMSIKINEHFSFFLNK